MKTLSYCSSKSYASQPASLFACLSACLPPCLPAHLPACQPACQPAAMLPAMIIIDQTSEMVSKPQSSLNIFLYKLYWSWFLLTATEQPRHSSNPLFSVFLSSFLPFFLPSLPSFFPPLSLPSFLCPFPPSFLPLVLHSSLLPFILSLCVTRSKIFQRLSYGLNKWKEWILSFVVTIKSWWVSEAQVTVAHCTWRLLMDLRPHPSMCQLQLVLS